MPSLSVSVPWVRGRPRPRRVSEGKMPSLSVSVPWVRGRPRPRRVSEGKMPSLEARASRGSAGVLWERGRPIAAVLMSASIAGDTLGARASRPRRVSEGRMPSLQEKCEHVYL